MGVTPLPLVWRLLVARLPKEHNTTIPPDIESNTAKIEAKNCARIIVHMRDSLNEDS